MPPSSDQDNNNLSNGSSQPSKLSQKASTSGVQIPTKSGRKNGTAKDGGGGVLAAVTKNSSKAPNAKPVPAQAHRVQSPDMKSTGSPSNGNPVTSPLLDALSSAALDKTPQNTNEWARNVSPFSSSPSNLINLGESPPTFSYEDRLANFGWTTREQRGIPGGYVSSASPPSSSRRRPLSYQLDNNFPQGMEDHRSQVSSYAARRSSMYSQHPRYAQHPPLPHQAQAHFYGAPDANLLLSPPIPGLVPGENGFYSGFDSLPTQQYLSKPADDVVVNGYEGGLNVYSVTKRGISKLSSLEGLRGGVYNAKILPWTTPGSLNAPLIALVIHGPAPRSDASSSGDDHTPPSEGKSGASSDSLQGSPRIHGLPLEETEPIEYYQTTVEVYSLGTKAHVATLLSLPKTRIALPTTSPVFRPPLPVGSLSIRADSGNVIVASGTTGETWIFRQEDKESGLEKFKCIGKIWTTVQHGVTVEMGASNPSPDDWHTADQPVRTQYKASIVSVNGRWLAYCPSVPTSQISLRAKIHGPGSFAKVPGVTSHAPPNLPNVNCTVDTPGGESVMKQIVQIGTQKFIEAGNYLTQQGLTAWNNYRNKPAQNQPAAGPLPYQNHANLAQQFPPTHGLQPPAPLVTKDPGLISILDLEVLAQHPSSTGSSPHPLATFRVPQGCSFLSFAPNGLALFTASNKGDVQFVWDLMRVQYAKSSFLKGGLQGSGVPGPHVRQIAQFSRMTIARIVDVVWTSPHGERAAMVTEPGTVHVLDLPASAFAWPPPRRRPSSQKAGEGGSETVGPALTATGVATSAVNSIWTAARPLVSRRRRSSVGISARTVTAQAGHGTQALAAGISRSVGAATGKMNEMRKSANTKLHLPPSQSIPATGCVLLLNGKRNDSVMVLGGGIVRIYTIKNRRADRPVDKQKASRGAKYVEFRLPSLPDIKLPAMTRDINQIADLELTERDIKESRWKARLSPAPNAKAHGTESSIPQAEIESNAPYQPFHTDRRVGLHIYSEEEQPLPPSPSVSALISPPRVAVEVKMGQTSQSRSPWAFGGPVNATKIDVGPPQGPDDDFDLSADHRALPSSAIERVMKVTDSTEDMEQIVITTRRRKGAPRAGPDNTGDSNEEGFFEDDCEVLDFASQRV